MAISGLHLSFVGIGMCQILRRITGSYPVGGVFGILFLALYILMVGFTVSAVRALTMFLFRVGADMTGRHYDAPTALSVAAVVVLLWRPLSLYDGGFWLSFGAVFAILAVVPVVQESTSKGHSLIHVLLALKDFIRQGMFVRTSCNESVLSDKSMGMLSVRKAPAQNFPKQNIEGGIFAVCLSGAWEHVWQIISQGLIASIGINLVILPILLYHFFEFPLYSFILNLFVIPLMSVLLFLGMAGSLFSLWFVPIAVLLFRICGKILWIYKMSCETALQLPGARLVIGRPDMWQIGVYYGILVIILLLLREKERLMEHVDDVKNAESKKHKSCGRGSSSPKQKGRSSGVSMQKYAVSESDVSMQKHVDGKPDTGIQKHVTRLGRFALMLGVAGIIILTYRWGERGKLTTVVLDVGQGDSIFMRGPKGGTYLVDGGSSDVKKAGKYRIEPFLKSQGV